MPKRTPERDLPYPDPGNDAIWTAATMSEEAMVNMDSHEHEDLITLINEAKKVVDKLAEDANDFLEQDAATTMVDNYTRAQPQDTVETQPPIKPIAMSMPMGSSPKYRMFMNNLENADKYSVQFIRVRNLYRLVPDTSEDTPEPEVNESAKGKDNISSLKGVKISAFKKSSMENNAKYIWRTLLANGFTKQAAAGILGNLRQESSFDPTIHQSNGPGVGIAQWSSGGRWDTLMAFASSNKIDKYALSTQVEFMIKEMKGPKLCGAGDLDYNHMRKISNINEAVAYFHHRFECSADSSMGQRNSYASEWFKKLKGEAPYAFK